MKKFIILAIPFIFSVLACSNAPKENQGDRQIITEKIEYPVFIKSPFEEVNGEWWKENIETSDRLVFVETLINWAYEGKVQAFDYLTNEPLSVEQVKAIGNEKDTIRVTESFPPYDEKDTVIQQVLDLKLIHKVKFLEEWSFNSTDHSMNKKVIGIAPALTVYADSLEVKGYKPLFWIYFDKDYIESLKPAK